MLAFLRAVFAAIIPLWELANIIAKWVNERREAYRLEQLAKAFDAAAAEAKEKKDTSEIDNLFEEKGP